MLAFPAMAYIGPGLGGGALAIFRRHFSELFVSYFCCFLLSAEKNLQAVKKQKRKKIMVNVDFFFHCLISHLLLFLPLIY